MTVAQMKEIVPHATGWYEGRLASYSMDQMQGKEDPDKKWVVVKLNFTAENPLSGQNMENVAVNRRYTHQIRVFDESDTDNIIELGKRLRPDIPTPLELKAKGEDGGTVEQYLEQLINTPARVELDYDKWMKENRDRDVLIVKSVRKVA
jgi:hypothetical protein